MESIEFKEVDQFTNKLIKKFDSSVIGACHLKDNRIALGFADKTIKIFNSTTFNLELTLEGHKGDVLCINQMEDGK